MNRDQILLKLSHNLSTFVSEFMKEPFSYFYEEDARSHLFVQLDKSFNLSQVFPVKSEYSSVISAPLISSIVKAEYPQSGGQSRFDIAILEPNLSNDFYNTPVSIAVELKLGSKFFDRTASFKEDLLKLAIAKRTIVQNKGISFVGIAIYLYQTPIDEQTFRSYYSSTFKTMNKIRPEDIQLLDNTVFGFIIYPNPERLILSSSQLYFEEFDPTVAS
jgi:hypothetical protein